MDTPTHAAAMTLARAVQRASDLGLETENDEVLDGTSA